MTGSTNAQTSNTSTRLWFYYIITKIHPPFQNPGFAPDQSLVAQAYAYKVKFIFKNAHTCHLQQQVLSFSTSEKAFAEWVVLSS